MKLDKRFGVCHICGKREVLTFEHVPPKAAFNDKSANLISLETVLKSDTINNLPWETKGLYYKQFQRGKGFYSLCRNCNNNTGAWYGNQYVSFISGIHTALNSIEAKKDTAAGLKMTLDNMYPLAILKQIISMFCSINPDGIGDKFRDFILDPHSHSFDQSKYKICSYLHKGSLERYCPVTSTANIKSLHYQIVSEIATYPVGYILYFVTDHESGFFGTDITSFSECDYDTPHTLSITLPFYETNTYFPTDFRLKPEILKTAEENQIN